MIIAHILRCLLQILISYVTVCSKSQLDAVEADLKSLTAALGSSQALTELVSNPSIPKGAKVAAVQDLAAKAGYAESTNNLLGILLQLSFEYPRLQPECCACCAALMAENNRLGELSAIAGKYAELLRAARGQIFADVTVAEV